MKITLPFLAQRVQSEADAYALMEQLRWGDGDPVCPHCGNEKAYFLTPANGTSRATRTGSKSERRVWKCAACRKQFSVLTGTIFHGTKIPLQVWLFVVFEMCAAKNGMSAREVERKYGLTPKSAWFMTQRIREAMKREPFPSLFSGRIVADETYIGGKPRNRHGGTRMYQSRRPDRKTPVLSLVNKETGEVRSHVIADVTGTTLKRVITENVNTADSHLQTDELRAYNEVGPRFQSHKTVRHSAWEYVRGDVSTNVVEGYFSQLKRSIDGTHHHVSVPHLPRYLAEFDYRYSTRGLSDSARTSRLFKQVAGRRLTYRPLTSS